MTSNFGTFLEGLSQKKEGLFLPSTQPVQRETAVTRGAESDGDPQDAAIRLLAAHDGRMTLDAMLGGKFSSMGPLTETISALQRFRLVELMDDGSVQLTATGQSAAAKLNP